MKTLKEILGIKLSNIDMNLTAKEFVLQKFPNADVLKQEDERCKYLERDHIEKYMDENNKAHPYLVFKYYKNSNNSQFCYYKNEEEAWEHQTKVIIKEML